MAQQLSGNKTNAILQAAAEGGYGVVDCIACNIEHILGFVRAAERKRSLLIIQLFPWAISFSDGILVQAAALAAKQSTVPVSVHLDHCQSEDLVKQSADLPFDSIMIDKSHLPKKQNLAKTAELVPYCRSRGKATEAEPGRIEGGEDGLEDTVDLSGLMTSPQEAQQFLNAVVDTLAPAFGNVHGEYGPRGFVLEFDRVNKFPTDLTRRLIAAGVTKVNLNRDILAPYYEHVEKYINKIPFTQLLEDGVEVIARSMGDYMDVVLSTGKAYSPYYSARLLVF